MYRLLPKEQCPTVMRRSRVQQRSTRSALYAMLMLAGLGVWLTGLPRNGARIMAYANRLNTDFAVNSVRPQVAEKAARVAAQQSLPTTTATPPQPTPVPTEHVETEYLQQMQYGTSNIVRVSIVYPKDANLVAVVEVPGNTASVEIVSSVGVSSPLNQALGPNYTAFAVAHLSAAVSAFDVNPADDQEYRLDGERPLSWQWVVFPKQEGAQVICIIVDVRFVPKNGGVPQVYQIYRKSLPVTVNVPVARRAEPIALHTVLTNLIGVIIGSLGTLGLTRLGDRKKRESDDPVLPKAASKHISTKARQDRPNPKNGNSRK